MLCFFRLRLNFAVFIRLISWLDGNSTSLLLLNQEKNGKRNRAKGWRQKLINFEEIRFILSRLLMLNALLVSFR